LPAVLAELAFYLAPGFDAVRRQFERLGPKTTRAGLLTASAGIPYAIASVSTGSFDFPLLCLLLALAGVASFWYAIFERGLLADAGFLMFMGGVYLSRMLVWIYSHPAPGSHLHLDVLGHLMWIRLGIMAVLTIRGFENIRFGFLPSRAEWKTGITFFVAFLPVAGILAFILNYPHFRLLSLPWWQYAARLVPTFLGVLWVVALGEEFFFRGFVQRLATRGLGSEIAGLAAASGLFGLVHLPFRFFPNWRHVILATALGAFCGGAFMRSRGIRAAMVTHALAATAFVLFFSA